MEKRLDFAIIGTLLVVLRLSYLSLLTNVFKEGVSPPRSKEDSYLLKHPVDMDIVSVAQLCLNQFKLLRRSALCIFQCALIMKEYHKYAPEDGCDGCGDGDSQIFTGMLIQMAMSIGINREPSKFDQAMSKQSNLWRKIWYRLVSADNFQAFILGNPPLISSKYYDTELPSFSYENSNIEDTGLEKEVIQFIKYRFELDKLLREVTSLVLDMKKPPFVSEVMQKLAPIHEHLRTEFKSLSHLMTPTNGDHIDNVRKVKRIIAYCETVSLLHPVYYHLLLHYDHLQNAAACKFFLEKVVSLVMGVITNFTELLKYSYKFVGYGFDLQLTPVLETGMHKTFQIQYAVCGRLLSLKKTLSQKNDDNDKEMIEFIDKFVKKIIIPKAECYLEGLISISGRYFYAWRMSKAHNILIRLFKEPSELLDVYLSHTNYNFFSQLSKTDMEYIADLMNTKKIVDNQTEHDNEANSRTPQSTLYSNSTFNYEPNKEIDNFWADVFLRVSADPGRTERRQLGIDDGLTTGNGTDSTPTSATTNTTGADSNGSNGKTGANIPSPSLTSVTSTVNSDVENGKVGEKNGGDGDIVSDPLNDIGFDDYSTNLWRFNEENFDDYFGLTNFN
ncbi:unnamed protein product [Ambrosiozyma monospora]|uniref:Unnamed protein product n=1 Tax=Ambrosiozyma monospora TaxID=43982 RepID=A0A9W7DM25_AMBMO|nr:unnamed protein product [Ambrosiozyma monospora]